MKHSEGPWKPCRSHSSYKDEHEYADVSFASNKEILELRNKPYVRIENCDGNITSAHDCFEFDNPYDAWLIASAPDLLQALTEMLPRFEAMADNLPAEQANDAYNTITFANFAIARATRSD